MAPAVRPLIQREIVDLCYNYNLDLDRDLGPIMRSWLQERFENPYRPGRTHYFPHARMDLYQRCSTALRWIRRYGERSDLDLIRRATWAARTPARRDTTSPEDVRVESYLRYWGDPEYPLIVRQRFSESLDYLLPRLERFEELNRTYSSFSSITARNRWIRQSREGYAFSVINRRRSSLRSDLLALARLNVPDLVELWRRAAPVFRIRNAEYYSTYAEDLLVMLAEYGEEGLRELEGIFVDPGAPPANRVQAGLLLVRHGRNDLTEPVLRLWELYRGTGGYTGRTLGTPTRTALLILLWEGNVRLAGLVIDNANRGYQSDGREAWSFSAGHFDPRAYSMGTTYWNTGLVEVLKHATGQDFGWDLKAWTRWWEREKDRLAGVN